MMSSYGKTTISVALVLMCGAFQGAPTQPLYAAAQAHTGAKIFAAHCAQCHGAQLQGTLKGTPLVGGPMHARRWKINQMYDFMSHQMPANARGSLNADQYEALMAFLLEKNGYRAGRARLTHSQIARVTTSF